MVERESHDKAALLQKEEGKAIPPSICPRAECRGTVFRSSLPPEDRGTCEDCGEAFRPFNLCVLKHLHNLGELLSTRAGGDDRCSDNRFAVYGCT